MSTDDQVRRIRTELTAIVDLLRLALEGLPEPTEPTPEPRTWALPEEPPVGTRLIGSDDDAWERDRDGWRWFSPVQRKWIETDEWIDILLVNGPFREATPNDMAQLGIEDPS